MMKKRRLRFPSQRGYVAVPGLFKGFIFFGTIAVAAVFIIYTQFVIGQLQENVKRDVRMWAKLWELAGAEDSSPRLNAVVFEEIIQKAYFPIIVTDTDKRPIIWARISDVSDNDTTGEGFRRILEHKDRMERNQGATPVSWNGHVIQYILYDYPPLVQQLQIMPMIEIAVVAVFLAVGFYGFRNIQRAEQRSIWVGMAKETAHQLGTPISSLLGWLEVMERDHADGKLCSQAGCSEDIGQVLKQMKGDIQRLDKVAMRFGQIGSIPETTPQDINRLVDEVLSYFRLRLPHGGRGVRLQFEQADDVRAKVNPELFSWVIENLVKNSLQATDGFSGEIILKTWKNKNGSEVCVSVTDNGSGIPPKIQKKVFQTGFSTKKRGWGLGLTLARRIVQDYHRGKIELKESVPRLRTTFQITLPYAQGGEVNKG